jgi:hypothetical protein
LRKKETYNNPREKQRKPRKKKETRVAQRGCHFFETRR